MSDNPFAAFAASLNDDQKAALMSALGGTTEPEEVAPKKRGRPAKKPVIVEEPVAVEEQIHVKSAKGGARKIVTEKFQVVAENGENLARRTAVRFRGNQWKDTGLDRNKKTETPEYEPMPRERPETKYVNKKCHVCGKEFEIKAELLHGEFHRCSKCI